MGDAHHDFKKIARKEFVMETIPIGDCEMIKDEDELLNELVDLPRSRIDSTESSIKSGIDSEGLNITIPSSGTEPEEENEEEDEGEDSEEKQHIIPDKPFIFNETEYLKNYIVGNVNHDSLINVLDNIIPNVPLFFIVDTCMGSFRKEITKKPLEGSIPRPLYWVQNAQTIYDPAGKTTISTDKGNKMFIEGENPNLKFVWDSSATKTYYPKWTFKKGKEIINYVDIDNKNELFYSKYDIYHINQKLDGEEHNYDSVAIIYNPEKKKYTIANKELSKIRSKVTELEYTENANFYEKMAKNLFKGSEPESFRNIINKRFVIKRLGDQGQALSCLTPVEKYSCYKNYRASSETEEILVGDGIHCFVTFDRPALVAALIYQLPMIIFNYHNGKFAIFIDKKYIGNNITEQKIKKIFNKQNENTLKIQLPRILEEYSKLYTEYSTIERAIYDSIEFINTKIKDDIHKNLDNTTITDEGYKGFLKTLAKLSPYMIQNSFYKKSNISFPSDEEYNILKERVKTIQTMKIEDIVKEINRYTGINQELKTMKSIHKEIFGIIPTIADYNTQIDKHKIDKHIESAINTTTITRNELRHPRSMDTVIERNTCISMVIDFYKNLKKFIDSADSYGVHDPIVLQAFEEYIRNILNYLINKTEGNPEYNNYVKTYITQIPEFEKILSPRENLAVAVSASASATGVPRKKEGGMYRNKEDYHATIYDMYDLLNTLFGICIEADAREKVCVFSKDPEKNKKMKDYMYKYIIEEKPRIYHKEPVKYNDIPYDSDDDVYFYNTFLNQIKWSPFAGVKEFFENVIDEYPTADTNVYIGEQLEATLYNIFERSNIRYRLNVKTRRRERNIQAEMRMKNTQYNELYPLPQKAQEQIAQMMKQRVPMSKIHELKNYEYKNEKSSYVTVAPYRNSMGGSRRYRKTKRRIPRPAPKKQTRRYKNPHRKTKKQRRIRK